MAAPSECSEVFRKASQKGPSTNRIPEREREYAHELREVPQHRDTKPRVSGVREALGQGNMLRWVCQVGKLFNF